jgi:glycosyltransferase involved in cell wall biosynthesis
MPSLYGRNDIFINGSCIDNAPCSIVEAFCCGLPVISTDAGGIPHLVQHEVTGLLSPSGDWSALAENVIRLLKNQGLAKAMAENGLKTAQRHSWTKVRADWLTLYRSL